MPVHPPQRSYDALITAIRDELRQGLARAEAAIIGADFPIPLTIQIREPEMKPKSDGPDFQKYWSFSMED